MNLPRIIHLITLLLLVPKGLSFDCADILEENLCLDSPGCQYNNQICSGQIQTTCSPPLCVYVDPQNPSQPQNGTIQNPFSSLAHSFLQSSGLSFSIIGLLRKSNQYFEYDGQGQVFNFQKSITLVPFQANAGVFQIRQEYTPTFFFLIGHAANNIEITMKKCRFLLDYKASANSQVNFISAFAKNISINVIDSYWISNKSLNFRPVIILKQVEIGKLKIENFLGSLSENIAYEIPKIAYPSRSTEVEMINCRFKGGRLHKTEHLGKGTLILKNVTFEGVDLSEGWGTQTSTIIFENVEFSNCYTTSSTTKIQDIFHFETATQITMKNIQVNNLTIYRESFIRATKSENLQITNFVLKEAKTQGPIFYFNTSLARFQQLQIQKVSFLKIGIDLPLCIKALNQATLMIYSSHFLNISSTCIQSQGSLLSIFTSKFSNQNLGSHLKTLKVNNSVNTVSWLFSSTKGSVQLSGNQFFTNYLPAKFGGVLHMVDGDTVSATSNKIYNTVANFGGSIYSTVTFFSQLVLFGNEYHNSTSLYNGGVNTIIANNNKVRGSILSLYEDFKNCTAGHSGDLFFIKGFFHFGFMAKFSLPVLSTNNYLFQFSELDDFKFTGAKFNITNEANGKFLKFLPPLHETTFSNSFQQSTQSSPQVNFHTVEVRRPKTYKVHIYALNKWQVQIANEKYYEEVMKNVANNNISEYEIKHISHLNLTDYTQKLNITLELKSSHRLPYIIMVSVFDQFGQPFYQDIEYDELFIEFKGSSNSSNTNNNNNEQDRFSMNGINSQKFSKYGVSYINIQNTYFAQIGSQKILHVKSNAQNLGIFQNIFQAIDFEIQLKFKECEFGDLQNNETQICDTCPQGLYSWDDPLNQFTSCQKCIDGMECLGSSIVLSKPHHWKYSQYSTKSVYCPYPKDCLGGAYLQNNVEPDFRGECKFPSGGNLCNQCAGGFIRSNPQTPCIDCTKDVGNYVLFGIMFILQILIIVVVILTTIRSSINKSMESSKSKEISDQELSKTKDKMGKQLFYISQLIRNGFNYFETIRIIYQFSAEQDPLFTSLLSGISYVLPSQDITFSIDCFIELMTPQKEKHFWIKYVCILFKPILIFIIIFLLTVLLNNFNRIKIQNNPNWGSFKLNRQYIVTMIIVIIYFNQPHIIISSLKLLNCQNLNTQEDPKYFLSSDSSIQCWEGTHQAIVFGLVIPMLVIWGAFVPIIALKKLRDQYKLRRSQSKKALSVGGQNKNVGDFIDFSVQASQAIENDNRKLQSQIHQNIQKDKNMGDKAITMQDEADKKSFSFLIYNILVRGSIKEEFYYWELLTTFRKFLLMLCFISLRSFDYIESLIFSVTIIIILGIIHIIQNPYRFNSLNKLDSIGFISIYFLLMALISIKGSESQQKVTYYIFNITFLILALAIIVFMIFGLGSSLKNFRNTQKLLAKQSIKNKYVSNSSDIDFSKSNLSLASKNASFETLIREKGLVTENCGKSNFAMSERKYTTHNSEEGSENIKEKEIEMIEEPIKPPLFTRHGRSYLHQFCGVEEGSVSKAIEEQTKQEKIEESNQEEETSNVVNSKDNYQDNQSCSQRSRSGSSFDSSFQFSLRIVQSEQENETQEKISEEKKKSENFSENKEQDDEASGIKVEEDEEDVSD